LRVLEHLVGLGDLLEARLGLRLLADVRVELAGQLPVGLLNLLRRGGPRDVQRLVVVLELHAAPSRCRSPGATRPRELGRERITFYNHPTDRGIPAPANQTGRPEAEAFQGWPRVRLRVVKAMPASDAATAMARPERAAKLDLTTVSESSE